MQTEAARAALWAARTVRRRWTDLAARAVVALGGLATVASIVTMLVFLGTETWPLARGARVVGVDRVAIPVHPQIVNVSTDEYRESAQIIRANGVMEFFRLRDGALLQRLQLPQTEGQQVRSALRVGPDQIYLWRDDGHLLALRLRIEPQYDAGTRRLDAKVDLLGQWPLVSSQETPAVFAASVVRDGNVTVAWLGGGGTVQLWWRRASTSLFGEEESAEGRVTVATVQGNVLVLNGRGDRLLVGREDGGIQMWDLSDPASPVRVDERSATNGEPIPVTALAYLLGDQAFVVGDQLGRVSVWQPVRGSADRSGWQLERIHLFVPHRAPVAWIHVSQRDKGFVTTDRQGNIALRHSTSEQTLCELDLDSPPLVGAVLAPKADGIIALSRDGGLLSWGIHNPHPEITLRTLFGKVWYEGYAVPEYVWQSTGGTDDFEPKFSLTPLLFGTVKGTVYALLFAVPIAVLAALYTALFSPPAVRNVVKPTVEVMAALPSVVLGFVAGLVLAPALERHMPGFLLALVGAPLMIALLGTAWFFAPRSWRGGLPHGFEVVAAGVALCALGIGCWAASGWFERVLFWGDFRHWLSDTLGARFDQRNCVVVGLAMGFAVIPLIFAITEEALSNVPQRLVSASLALGATPWQTAMRVVLPAASPGIFSAVMIGFGRAVGETMIVLMATGNTPVMEWNIFTGMRTLSANIAVEIPEAPYASTLYRVLFLAALLLFVVTFVVNTLAEIVRQRLRERYQQM
ncbi:MAG: phosphate ABC transporter permease [Candidatus Binatia bacterium]|nr:MAG: phosphate ABC transporter permease [Candidatus Binatia bacterium]